MSSVRTLALGALMIVGVAGVSAAQSTTTPPTRAQRSGEMRRGGGRGGFGADLNLTEAQKAQIKTIRAKYKPQNEALRAQAKPFMDAAHAARQKGDTATARAEMLKARNVMQGGQTFRNQENAEIRAILTPEQQAKWDARQKQMGERGKGEHKGWGRKGKTAPAAKS